MNMSGASLSVIVLAGGRSRRMGKDKALLTHQGQSLIGRTIQVAQKLSNDVLIVTPWPERYQSSLPDSVRYITESLQAPSAGPLSGFSQGWQQTASDWSLLLACDLPYLEVAVLQRWWQWILACDLRGWPNLPAQPMASLVLSQIPLSLKARDSKAKDSKAKELKAQDLAAQTAELKGQSSKAQASMEYLNIQHLSLQHSDTRICWQPLCGYYHRSCLTSLNQQLAISQCSFQTWLSSLSIACYNAVPPRMLFNCNTPTDWQCVVKSTPQSASIVQERSKQS